MYYRVGLIGPTQKLGYQYFLLYSNFEIKKAIPKEMVIPPCLQMHKMFKIKKNYLWKLRVVYIPSQLHPE